MDKRVRGKLILLILFFVSFESFADKLEKGFERLKIYDYFQAKKDFEETLQKKTAGGAYGLSIIYSLNNNPFFNLDSARFYILMSDSAFHKLNEKGESYYRNLGITSSSIQIQKDSVCERSFRVASAASNVEKLNTYIHEYPFCSRLNDAIQMRNTVAFADAKAINTSVAYKKFIDNYPGAKELTDAKSRYEEKVYDEATADNKISSFEKYLSGHSSGPYNVKAERSIYLLSVPHKTVSEYHSFVTKYPHSKYTDEAWRELFKLYTKDYSDQVLSDFKKQFPDYPFKEELDTDFELQRSLFLPFSKNNKWGFINDDGKEMIKPEFDEVLLFSEGLAAAEKDGKYGFINKAGKVIIQFAYDDAESFRNNAVIVKKNEKSGLIGRNGEELIPIVYDDLSDISDGIYIAVQNDKSAYISRTGEKKSEFIFDFAGDFKEGFAIAGVEEKFGLLNSAFTFAIEPQYDELVFMSNFLLKARQDDHWGIINIHGDVIVPFVYEAIGDFNDHRALVSKNKKCGFVDESGVVIIPLAFSFQESLLNTAVFKDGYVVVKQKNKSILLDSFGNKINFPGFEDIGLPSEGILPVRKNKKWGFADLKGKLKIGCIYDQVNPFQNGFAKVKLKKMTGIIDSSGNIVIAPAFEDIQEQNNYFITRSEGRTGLISKEGLTILSPENDRIEFLSDKIASASGDKLLYVNLQSGKVIWKSKE